MHESQFVMHPTHFEAIQVVIEALVDDCEARGIFVVDRVGQLINQAGSMRDLDTTSLASLAASCVAASGGLAGLLGVEHGRRLGVADPGRAAFRRLGRRRGVL